MHSTLPCNAYWNYYTARLEASYEKEKENKLIKNKGKKLKQLTEREEK